MRLRKEKEELENSDKSDKSDKDDDDKDEDYNFFNKWKKIDIFIYVCLIKSIYLYKNVINFIFNVKGLTLFIEFN